VLRGHQWGVSSAAFSPDGSRIVTASLDQTARIWDTATAKETVGAARARGLCVVRCVQPRRVAHRHGLK
jgi:WD40 repeat protein